MKHAWLGCLLAGSLLFAGTQDSDLNVNKRYTVDTVTVAGKVSPNPGGVGPLTRAFLLTNVVELAEGQ